VTGSDGNGEESGTPSESVVFIESIEPIHKLYKKRMTPYLIWTLLSLIASYGFLIPRYSNETVSSALCFVFFIFGIIWFSLIFHFQSYQHYNFNEMKVDEDAVTFILDPNRNIPQAHVCLVPYSDLSLIRWNESHYDLVKLDGTIIEVPHAYWESKVNREMIMAFRSHLKETIGGEVPIFFSPPPPIQNHSREKYGVGSLRLTADGEEGSFHESFGKLTILAALFTFIFGGIFLSFLLGERTFDQNAFFCFGLSSMTLLTIYLYYKSAYEKRNVRRHTHGIDFSAAIRDGFYIAIARGEQFEKVVRNMTWGARFAKRRRYDARFEEDRLDVLEVMVSLVLIPLFFMFISSIGVLLYFSLFEHASLEELITPSTGGYYYLSIPSFPILAYAYKRLNGITMALAKQDVRRINDILGKRYWGGMANEGGGNDDRS